MSAEKAVENRDFETQFAYADVYEVHDSKVRSVEIKPEHPISDVPVLIAGGWSEGRKALKSTAEEIFKNDRTVILVDHARHGKAASDIQVSREVKRRSDNLLMAASHYGHNRVDIIGHSLGFIDAAVAASREPWRVRSLVGVQGGGMIGEDSVPALLTRFTPKTIRTLTTDMKENPEAAKATLMGANRYVAANPAKAAREVAAVAHTPIDNLLEQVRAEGVWTALIQSESDPVFPSERNEENVTIDGIRRLVGTSRYELARWLVGGNLDSYASIANKNAGHDDLLIHPEQSAQAALQVIAEVERRETEAAKAQ